MNSITEIPYTKWTDRNSGKRTVAGAAVRLFFIVLLLTALYFTAFVNYLLFHTLAELFSIVVASCLFMIVWHSKNVILSPYLLFIGVAYLFIAALDLLHTLAYKGMPIFTDYDFYANQLWIGARFMESLTLLMGFVFLRFETKIRPYNVLTAYAVITSGLILAIFYWKIFPICFVEGQGLTLFKKVSEYVICGILLVDVFLLRKNRARFEKSIYSLILVSILCTIISELAFTFYVSNYGFSNMVGHYFKLFSFYLIYKAILITTIEQPYKMIFRELVLANEQLTQEIGRRRKAEKRQEKLIGKLRAALDEIRALRGILPICSVCKKIRDDSGYWNQLESYIQAHSQATFSHSICPACAKKMYPDLDLSK